MTERMENRLRLLNRVVDVVLSCLLAVASVLCAAGSLHWFLEVHSPANAAACAASAAVDGIAAVVLGILALGMWRR